MKVIIELDLTDEQRRQIVAYWRSRDGKRGLPPLARREDIREFVAEALNNHWLAVGDQLDLRAG